MLLRPRRVLDHQVHTKWLFGGLQGYTKASFNVGKRNIGAYYAITIHIHGYSMGISISFSKMGKQAARLRTSKMIKPLM